MIESQEMQAIENSSGGQTMNRTDRPRAEHRTTQRSVKANPRTSTTLSKHWSRRLVNHLHLFFIHPATLHFDFRNRSVDLTKIRGRKLNIDGS